MPKDEESLSGNLLVRSGMIKKVGAGIYMYLPLGYKVLDKIMKIIKEEMDKAGAEELLMPSLIPSEYYEKSSCDPHIPDTPSQTAFAPAPRLEKAHHTSDNNSDPVLWNIRLSHSRCV